MWKRYFIILSLVFIYESGISQNTFSESDLQDFVNIYMTSKSKDSRSTKQDEALFRKCQISPERYQLIAQARTVNKEIKLDSREAEFFEELEKLKVKTKEEKESRLRQLCSEQDLPFSKFESILKKYKTDISFQRSLQPYFKNYFKRQK